MTARWKERTIAVAGLGIPVGVIYALTAAPSLSFIDSGELATVAWTLGIAHPTGYPLFTLIGYLASHAPLALAPIYKLNLLSVFLAAAGAASFFLLLLRIIGGGSRPGAPAKASSQAKGKAPRDAGSAIAAALFGSLTLAFSSTWWAQSASVEVYPLHCLFLLALTGLFLSSFPRRGQDRNGAMPHLFTYVLGLSFSNHMSTIYLAPAFLTLYFMRRGAGKESVKYLFALAPAFLAGLSINLYLPIRASAVPLMDWGNPVDLPSILRHLGGKQYGVWLFSSTATAVKQLSYFFVTIGPKFSYVPLALALWGMRDLYRRDRDVFVLVLLLFAGCLAWAVNYDIEDIDSYFLLADIAVAMAAGAGAFAILTALRGRARTAAMAAAGLLLGAQAARSWPDADQSGLRQVDQYSRAMLAAADAGAIIISYQWDYFVSASFYLQAVEGFRPDVMVVDKELLRRSWYVASLKRLHPELLSGLERETDAYLRELYKFENGIPYDPREIEGRYAALIAGIVGRHYADRAVYVTADIEAQYTEGYARVPHGLMLRLRRKGDPDLWREVPVAIDPSDRDDRYMKALTLLAARAEYVSAGYLRWKGDEAAALRAVRRSLAIRPDYADARQLLESFPR
jgi:hypothetical protein